MQTSQLPEITQAICPECKAMTNIVYGSYALHKYKGKRCKGGGQDYISPEITLETNGELVVSPELKIKENLDEVLDEYERNRPYFPYQKKVHDWAKNFSKMALFLEMRLGKTMIAIRWVKRLIKDKKIPEDAKILVSAPKTVVRVWEKELVLEGIKRPKLINVDTARTLKPIIEMVGGWFITNYECITATDLETIKWDVVILDESNKIKDPRTKITKRLLGKIYEESEVQIDERGKPVMDSKTGKPKKIVTYRRECNLFPEVSHKAILTGTPAPENFLDYWNQCAFIGEHLFGTESWYQFKDKFFMSVGPNKYELLPHFKEVMAGVISKFAYVLKRDQVGIGSVKVYQQRYVDFDDPKYREQYQQFELNWFNKQFETQWAIVAYQWLQQLSGGFPKPKEYSLEILRSYHKIKELENLVYGEDLHKEPILIWAKHVDELEAIKNALSGCEVVDGDVSVPERHRLMDMFNERKLRILACQIKTASFGLNLSVSDTAIYYSNELGATYRQQSEDRIIDPRKKSPVLYIDLLTPETIDEDVYAALKEKHERQDSFLRRIFDLVKERTHVS